MSSSSLVPKSFDLAGAKWSVVYKEGMQKGGALGQTHPNSFEIWLDKSIVPEDLKAITFYHELFHAMFHTLGKTELYQDEALVDTLGSLMWQVIKTSKFDKEKS